LKFFHFARTAALIVTRMKKWPIATRSPDAMAPARATGATLRTRPDTRPNNARARIHIGISKW
jgi:hypothetical protein